MKVYLVGSGPGDPELLTLKAKRVLETADVVLFDHLASPDALRLAANAEKIYVGKRRDDHSFPQEEIGAMLVGQWRSGKRVVRLKGGDPFLFGRGGEECEAMQRAGVPFEVVPGVSAALGAAAYAGIPVTHRDHASAAVFVTGHHPASMDWKKLALVDTVVVFMGVQHYAEVAEAMMSAGRDGATPAAAVTWATRPQQRTVVATLATLGTAMQDAGIGSPAMVYIGGVALLANQLNWFEALPLHGIRVAITRPRRQSPEFAQRLLALGAEPIEYPTIEIAPPESWAPLDQAIDHLNHYDWLLFTSVNGVEAFRERLRLSPWDLRHLQARICAIGPATRAAVEALHLKVDIMPEEYVAESLLDAMASFDLVDKKILLPRAAVARDLAPLALRERGANVDVVDAYRTIVPASGEAPEAEWITFTSSSTVKNFIALNPPGRLAQFKIASIGPVTSDTLRMHGFPPTVEASPYTTEGILNAILAHSNSTR